MLYSLPFVSALIGWVTNYIAVKMLFHPKKEVTVLSIKIQGVFPKRQRLLAEKLGKIVSQELFSFSDIKNEFSNPDNIEGVIAILETRIDDFLNDKISSLMPMLSMFINDSTKQKIKTALLDELTIALPVIIDQYAHKLEKSIDVEKIVFEKVNAFSSDKLEEILFSIMKKEFTLIEILGGVLGFVIGLVQLLIIKLSLA